MEQDLGFTSLAHGNLREKHVRQLTKTEMCKFFLSNRCSKGSRCQFAHSASEIREKPDLFRTSMCRTFLQTGSCDTPGCSFAHDERDLRVTSAFFKTRLCRFAESGRCKHGLACRFAHNPSELATVSIMGLPPPPEDASVENFSQTGLGSEFGAEFATDWGSNNSGSQQGDAGSAAVGLTQGSDQGGRQSSNQSFRSTRAETSASISTPEGSGDSGQEEFSRGDVQRGLGGRRAGRRVGERHCTTVMITNVPNFLTQGSLISLLEDLTPCMRGAFDFFYCPWNPCQDSNLGYAIINFFSRCAASDFERQWTNQPLLPKSQSVRRLRIVPAALQGRAANLRHFSGFSLAHHEDPRFRPLVRASPQEPLKPMAISSELQENPQPVPAFTFPPKSDVVRNPSNDCSGDWPGAEWQAPILTSASQQFMASMMPGPYHVTNEGLVRPVCGGDSGADGQRWSSASGSLEQQEPMPPGAMSCWAFMLPPGAKPGMAGVAGADGMIGPGSSAAMNAVPYYPGPGGLAMMAQPQP